MRAARKTSVEAVMEDLSAIRQDLESLAVDSFGAVKDQAKATYNGAVDVAKRVGQEVKERAEATHEAIGEFAQKRPITTILLSVAGGLLVLKLVSWLWGRR